MNPITIMKPRDCNACRYNTRLRNKTEFGSEAINKRPTFERFVIYLPEVFKSNLREIIIEEENKLLSEAIIVISLNTPIKFFTVKEVRAVIKNLNPKKAPGYDLITNQIL